MTVGMRAGDTELWCVWLQVHNSGWGWSS